MKRGILGFIALAIVLGGLWFVSGSSSVGAATSPATLDPLELTKNGGRVVSLVERKLHVQLSF